MRLVENPKDEDLEIAIYWVDGRRPWPVDSENRPLEQNSSALLPMNEKGLALDESKEYPDQVKVWYKMLNGKENDDIQSKMLNTRMIKKRVRRGGRTRMRDQVDTEIDVGQSSLLKIQAAVTKWEGIEDDAGKPAPLEEKYIDLLPAWLRDDLVDRITSLSSLEEEELGE